MPRLFSPVWIDRGISTLLILLIILIYFNFYKLGLALILICLSSLEDEEAAIDEMEDEEMSEDDLDYFDLVLDPDNVEKRRRRALKEYYILIDLFDVHIEESFSDPNYSEPESIEPLNFILNRKVGNKKKYNKRRKNRANYSYKYF